MSRTEVQTFFAQHMPTHLPMRERWQRLVRWLDGISNKKLQSIVDHVENRLDLPDELPDELRVSPPHWIRESVAQSPSPKLRIIRNLVMGKPPLGDLKFIRILSHSFLCEVSRIKLFAHRLGDDSAVALAERTSSARIRTINCSANLITSSGLEALANSRYLGNLRELYLGRNKIGDPGAFALAKSRSLPNLSLIDLRDNPIGQEAWQALRNAANLENCEIRASPTNPNRS